MGAGRRASTRGLVMPPLLLLPSWLLLLALLPLLAALLRLCQLLRRLLRRCLQVTLRSVCVGVEAWAG